MSVGSAEHQFAVEDDGIHLPFFATYADSAARIADTRTAGPRVKSGDPGSAFRDLVADDVHKLALQLDDNSIWLLLSITPTWKELFSGGEANRVDSAARKGTAGSISKGQAVYLTGYDLGNAVIQVELAKADSAATMPCLGVAATTITDVASGDVRLVGQLDGFDTNAYPVGTELYVSAATAGEFSATRPIGATDRIQIVAQVARQDVATGVVDINHAGRANDLPQLTTGKTWVGGANNKPEEQDPPTGGSGALRNGKTGLVGQPAGMLAINGGDNTKVDIGPNAGFVLDMATDPQNPDEVELTWTAFNAITLTNLATASFTELYIEDTGAAVAGVFQATTLNGPEDRRNKIYIGTAIHTQGTIVEAVAVIPVLGFDVGATLDDFMAAVGDLNLDGNVYGANGANLLLNKTPGEVFGRGIGTSLTKPNNKDTPAGIGIGSYLYQFQIAPNIWTTSIESTTDPDQLDTGSGLTAVNGGKYTIQRLTYGPRTNTTFIEYGQNEYGSLEEAIDGLSANDVTKNPQLSSLNLRGWLLIQEGTTDIDAALLSGDAKFVEFTNEIAQGSGTGTDPTAIHVDIPGEILIIPEKTATHEDDIVAAEDSEDSFEKVRVKRLHFAGVTKNASDGLIPGWTSITALSVSAGYIRADGDDFTIKLGASQALAITTAGANGLDTGVEAANQIYSIWVIGDSTGVNPTATLLSASPTAPTLPGTHDKKARIGFVANFSGDFVRYRIMGNGRTRQFRFDLGRTSAPQRVLSSGGATLYADIDLTDLLPVLPMKVYFMAQQSSSFVATRIRPNGSADASGPVLCQADNSIQFSEVITDATIEYENTGGGGSFTLDVSGFDLEVGT